MSVLNRVLGPRVTKEEMEAHAELYRRPSRLFIISAILSLVDDKKRMLHDIVLRVLMVRRN